VTSQDTASDRPPALLDQPGRFLVAFRCHVADHDVRAPARERQGGGAPDAAGRAAEEGDPPVEAAAHRVAGLAGAGFAGSTVAAQLPRRLSASADLEPGSAVQTVILSPSSAERSRRL
jgi:hypothetical protein